MTGNAVAVGKKLGVQPTLARRVAAAGRNGKRLTTGDQENVRAIIGKGLLAAGGRAARKAIQARPSDIDALGGDTLSRHFSSRTKLAEGVGSGLRTQSENKLRSGAAYRAGMSKAAPGTNGLGMLVPAHRGVARNSLVAQSSATATGQQKGSKLASFGGTKPATAGMSGAGSTTSGGGAPSGSVGSTGGGVGKALSDKAKVGLAAAGAVGGTAALSQTPRGKMRRTLYQNRNNPQFREALTHQVAVNMAAQRLRAAGADVKVRGEVGKGVKRIKLERRVKGIPGMKTGARYDTPLDDTARAIWDATAKKTRTAGGNVKVVRKRTFDPEDERRHRQGALSASGILGGAALAQSGGRDVVRETKGVRRARAALDPGNPPMHRASEWRTGGRLRKPTPQESLGELMAHDTDMKRYGQRLDAYRKLRNPKGAVVTGRAAGKLGVGLAAIAGGANLYRQRREPRYD